MPAPSPSGLQGAGPLLCPTFGDAGTATESAEIDAEEGVGGRCSDRPCLFSPVPGLGPARLRRVSRDRGGHGGHGTCKGIKRLKNALRRAAGWEFSFQIATEETSILPNQLKTNEGKKNRKGDKGSSASGLHCSIK